MLNRNTYYSHERIAFSFGEINIPSDHSSFDLSNFICKHSSGYVPGCCRYNYYFILVTSQYNNRTTCRYIFREVFAPIPR